jgi:hypothetical protein
MATNQIDVDGVNYEVQGQAIYGSSEVAYVIIVFLPRMGG